MNARQRRKVRRAWSRRVGRHVSWREAREWRGHCGSPEQASDHAVADLGRSLWTLTAEDAALEQDAHESSEAWLAAHDCGWTP